MKILFVIDPWALTNCGATSRNYLFVQALTKIGQVQVACFRNDTDAVLSGIKNCEVVYSPDDSYNGDEFSFFGGRCPKRNQNKYVRGIKSLFSLIFSPSKPNSFFRTNENIQKIVDELVSQNGYDLIACRYFESAINCGLFKYKERLVLDVDDNPSNIFSYAASLCDGPFALRLLHQYKLKLMPRMVEKTLDKTFCSFYSSILERPSKTSIYLHNSTMWATNIPDILSGTANRMLFVCNMAHIPNRYGIEHFVTNIFPLIRKKVKDVELRVVGEGDSDLQDYLNKNEGVTAPGYVDDLHEEYKNARVVIVPIYHGSGTSVKFVEGMFMNRPIVSTPVGARGFDGIVKDGVHYLLAKTDEDFANKTVELLLDTKKSVEMANKAREIVKDNFSQVKFMEIVKDTIESKLRRDISRL